MGAPNTKIYFSSLFQVITSVSFVTFFHILVLHLLTQGNIIVKEKERLQKPYLKIVSSLKSAMNKRRDDADKIIKELKRQKQNDVFPLMKDIEWTFAIY